MGIAAEPPGDASVGRARYRIVVRGSVPESGRQIFGDHALTTSASESGQATTTLTGWIEDQAALTGVLRALLDYQLPVLSVERLEEPSLLDPSDAKSATGASSCHSGSACLEETPQEP